jgi:4-hydroxy-tetrahydrodipicolinate synthase
MKNLSAFKGTGVALITPFEPTTKAVSFTGLQQLLDFTAPHVNYFVVLGTTGESATLSKSEKKQVLDFVKQNNPHKRPIVYGLGGNDTAEVLATIAETDFAGIDAILSVSPYYNKPTQEGIYQHYKAVADASPVPVILYNVPGRTMSNVTAATTLRLAAHPNIIGIKEASGNLEQCMAIAAGKPQDFMLISGDDMLTVPMMSFGASGVISVLANAYPKHFCRMINLGLAGNFAEAGKMLLDYVNVNPLMYEESNPVGVKAAAALQGVGSTATRLPLLDASESLQNKIQTAHQHLVS